MHLTAIQLLSMSESSLAAAEELGDNRAADSCFIDGNNRSIFLRVNSDTRQNRLRRKDDEIEMIQHEDVK